MITFAYEDLKDIQTPHDDPIVVSMVNVNFEAHPGTQPTIWVYLRSSDAQRLSVLIGTSIK